MYIIIYKLFPNGFNTPQLIHLSDDASLAKLINVLRSERSERWVFHLFLTSYFRIVINKYIGASLYPPLPFCGGTIFCLLITLLNYCFYLLIWFISHTLN